MLQTFFTQRVPKGNWVLKGHSNDTWALGHLKTLGHSRLLGPWALRHSKGTLNKVIFFVCVEDQFLHFFNVLSSLLFSTILEIIDSLPYSILSENDMQ